ncbi:MAG: toxin-activating lysine-acyltransferase [Pseudomonadota bacterium]
MIFRSSKSKSENDPAEMVSAGSNGRLNTSQSSNLTAQNAMASPMDDEDVNGAPAQSSDTDADSASTQALDPVRLKQVVEMRGRLHETFGNVALAVTSVPRYRNLAIADLKPLVLDPLLRDRIAIGTLSKDGEQVEGLHAGFAIWASVSEAVDGKIREQISAGTFPVRLQPDDWNSGDINWLLDVIAPNRQMMTSLLANFRQVVKDKEMRVHPIVTQMLDAETLEKLGINRTSDLEAGQQDR